MDKISIDEIGKINDKYDVVIINTFFDLSEIALPYKNDNKFEYIEKIYKNIDNVLNKNSILFIYGITQELIYYYKYFSKIYTFKYMIVSDIYKDEKEKDLPHRHIDVLMMVKGNGLKNLDVKEVRIPYIGCENCHKNVKDWGGKKHLMNKNGTAISDVWKDFYEVKEINNDLDVVDIKLNFINTNSKNEKVLNHIIPEKILNRLIQMTNKKSESYLIVNIEKNSRKRISAPTIINDNNKSKILFNSDSSIENKVILADSIKFLKSIIKKHPNGYFDLIFADPPYNLVKKYSDYNDGMSEEEYIMWCNEWLSLSAKALKPDGSLIVLNIPKWSLHHSLELNKYMYLKNWIVWDSLSIPLGKIMPAHYGLLYYVKNPNSYTFNIVESNYKQNLCLRAKCIKSRAFVNNYTKINDIWSDIHRIKHKKDRDNHPCQLPYSLMERIINMTTNKGDIVYDPFGGTGSTAIVAKQLERRYCISELSKEYVDIANNLLENIEKNGELIRDTKKTEKNNIPKKQLETDLQKLAKKLNHKPTIKEFIDEYPLYTDDTILKIYGNYNKLLKTAKVVLE